MNLSPGRGLLGRNDGDVEQLLTAAQLSVNGSSDKVSDKVSDKGDVPEPQNVQTSDHVKRGKRSAATPCEPLRPLPCFGKLPLRLTVAPISCDGTGGKPIGNPGSSRYHHSSRSFPCPGKNLSLP